MKHFILFGILFFLGVTLAVTFSLVHNSNEILLSINGYSMTLQEAINNNFLKDNVATPTRSYTTRILAGHEPDEINIYLGESYNYPAKGTLKLSSAISNKDSLCREQTSNLLLSPNQGHLASEIMVSISGSEMDLQTAIDTAKFCSYSWKYGEWGVCNAGTQTRSAWCERSDGKNMPDAFCTATKPSTSQCCPVDGGWSNWVAGVCSVPCGEGTITSTRTCTNPAPSCGGADCVGDAVKTEPCYFGSCGFTTYQWTPWGTGDMCTSSTCARYFGAGWNYAGQCEQSSSKICLNWLFGVCIQKAYQYRAYCSYWTL